MIVADADHTAPAAAVGDGVVTEHRQTAECAAGTWSHKAADVEDPAIQCDIMQDTGMSASSKNNDVFGFGHGAREKYRDY